MIHEVEGDILLSKAAAIAHGVAPNDDFHQGLALSLRDRWPAMYKDFRHYCHVSHPKAGGVWLWGGAGGPRIVALFTQEAAYEHGKHPGPASVANVNHVLRDLAKLVREEKLTSLALPKLATGVGGLAWADVQPLVQSHLGDVGVPVYVYTTYHAGQAAKEPGT